MKFQLETANLELHVCNAAAADLVLDFYLRNIDIFAKYEPITADDFYTVEHQAKILDFEYKNILKLGMVRYWIFEKNNPNKIIGTVSYRSIIKPIYSSCTLGYKMDQAYTNRGLCTEAISASLPIITDEIGIHRVEAFVLPDNEPSKHILEKLGFEQEGLIRDKITIQGIRRDHLLYSFLANN